MMTEEFIRERIRKAKNRSVSFAQLQARTTAKGPSLAELESALLAMIRAGEVRTTQGRFWLREKPPVVLKVNR